MGQVLPSNSDQIATLNEQRSRKQAAPVRRTGLDNISYSNGREAEVEQKYNQAIKTNVDSLTSDPIMAAIFEDTARTTVQSQSGAERAGPSAMQGDAAHRQASTGDPTELFAESANKWAKLAFSD